MFYKTHVFPYVHLKIISKYSLKTFMADMTKMQYVLFNEWAWSIQLNSQSQSAMDPGPLRQQCDIESVSLRQRDSSFIKFQGLSVSPRTNGTPGSLPQLCSLYNPKSRAPQS